MLRRFLAGVLFSAVCISSLKAADDTSLAGREVTVVTWDAQFTVDDKATGKPEFGDSFTVDRVDGDRLWIESRGGYLKRSDVVPKGDAIKYFTRRINNDESPSNYTDRGLFRMKRGELDEAIGDFNEAIRLDTKYALAYYYRGSAWWNKGHLDGAFADFSVTIQLDPKHAQAYDKRARAWMVKNEFDKAIADCNEAIRLDPEYAMTYCNRGRAWYSKSENKKAIADFNEAIRLDPKDAQVYKHRGQVWARMEEYDKAIADFTEALRLGPEDMAHLQQSGPSLGQKT